MSRPWMKMYWADYLADTMHLTQGQHGAYMLLLAHYWNKGSVLAKHCYNIARATTEQEKSNVDEVLEQFFVRDGDQWINRRIEHELLEADEAYKRRAVAGSKGGKAKSSKNSHVDAEANDKQSSSNATAGLQQPEPEPEPEPDISITGVIDMAQAPPDPAPVVTKKPREVKRAAQLPADFYPDETGIRYAEERRVNVAIELTSFRNWHCAKGTTLKDWQAGWRNWCDKAVEFGRAGSKPAGVQANQRSSVAAEREAVSIALTGRKPTAPGRIASTERDITGECSHVA